MTAIAVQAAVLKAARHEIGVREEGANNQGHQVNIYQEADDLPGVGYAWCNSFVDFCLEVSGCTAVLAKLGDSASVDLTFHNAANLGWVYHASPSAGSLVIYSFSHIGIVDHELPHGQIDTVEGNTGSTGSIGAVSDSKQGGDGVYEKVRSVGLVRGYVRLPGTVDDAILNKFLGNTQPKIVAHTGDTAFWLWMRWKLGEGEFKKWGKAKIAHRPNAKLPKVGDPIYSKTWIPRYEKFLLNRKVA